MEKTKAYRYVADTCRCGKSYLVVADRELRASIIANGGADDLDIFLCRDELVSCSSCGHRYGLPIPELMDVERSKNAKWFADMINEIESDQRRPDYQAPEIDIPF